jgi:hypothetical protein
MTELLSDLETAETWAEFANIVASTNQRQAEYMKRRKELGLKPGDSFLEAIGLGHIADRLRAEVRAEGRATAGTPEDE